MTKTAIERLTARQRDCLRLVSTNHSTKEIARILKLSPNTVDGYVAEAKEILGVGTRREAARIFLDNCPDQPPRILRGDFSRVAQVDGNLSDSKSELLVSHRNVASRLFGLPEISLGDSTSVDSFHWFRGTREHNSLSTVQRLIWIAAGTTLAAVVFLTAIAIIDSLQRLIVPHTP